MKWRVVAFAVALAIAAIPTALAAGSRSQLDLSHNKRNTLSDQSVKVARSAKVDVKMAGVFRQKNPDRQMALDLLKRYAEQNGHISWQMIDPDVAPGVAAAVGVDDGAVVVGVSGKLEQAGSVSEYGISTALYRVLQARRVSLCSTEGHGERRFDDDTPLGYSTLVDVLFAYGISTKTVNLAQTGAVPKDCDAVMVAGPSPFSAPELAALENFRQHDGRFLVMLDPEGASLDELLGHFQLKSPAGKVLDPRLGLQGDPASIYIEEYPSANPVTQGLPPIALVDARPIVGTPIKKLRSGVWISRLMAPSEEAHVEVGGTAEPIGANALLGAAVDDSAIAHENSAIRRTRLIAIGNSGFATNAFVNQLAGGSLMTRSVGWLAQAEELATISFRPTDRSRVFLSKGDATMVRAVAYGLCPAFFALIGVSLLLSRLREDRKARSQS